MSEFPSLPLFTDAFIADTGHLSAAETGAYLMLLMIAWRTPTCSLPDDDSRLSRWARVEARHWPRMKQKVMEFWSLVDGRWTQKRLLRERDKCCKFAAIARENGKRGGRPKLLINNNTRNPAGLPNKTQQKAPISISKSIDTELRSVSRPKRVRTRAEYLEDFEGFWKGYPTDANMSKAEAAAEWQRLSLEDREAAVASLPGFRSYCQMNPDYRPVHAVRYLKYRRFDGHLGMAQRIAESRFIERGTPQWDAWQAYLVATKGKGSPTTERAMNGTMAFGWDFPGEWPPQREAAHG